MFDAFDISASAMSAQRLRLDVISGNLANVNTTRGADGKTQEIYRRKNVVFGTLLPGGGSATTDIGPASVIRTPDGRFKLMAGVERMATATGVQVTEIADDHETPLREVYDPTHPDANEEGYVKLPNINVVTEMVDMITATRAYEANVTAFQAAKQISQSALEM